MESATPLDHFHDKPAARAWVRATLRQLVCADLAIISRDCAANVIELIRRRVTNNPPRIMVYVPFRHEIDPILVASYAISIGGSVCIGSTSDRGSPLCPILIEPEVVRNGVWNITDPVEDAWGAQIPRAHIPADPSTIDAVITPGMAFDRQGGRLGRGAGVYDRFLARLTGPTLRVGIVPSALLVDRLPTEAHDVRMHAVATERDLLIFH